MNAHVERFNRTISDDFIGLNKGLLRDEASEFNKKLIDWLIRYNTERLHWSLNLQSPIDYLINNGYLFKMRWIDIKAA